jgi:hypothetical protein
MQSDLDLLLQLQAARTGRAQRAASRLSFALMPHALIVAPIAMAGEDGSLHAVAYARPGGRTHFMFCPDPRERDLQDELLIRFGRIIDRQVEICVSEDEFPQLIVPSGSAAELLETIADLVRFREEIDPLRRMGSFLAWNASRRFQQGQQALLVAPSLLAAHFRTGMPPGEDGHLLASLEWHGTGERIWERVAAAELIPMGVRTDPEFDRLELAPVIDGYHGSVASEKEAARAEIGVLLRQVAEEMVAAVQRALSVLEGSGLRPLPGLEEIVELDRESFADHLNHIQAKGRIPLRERGTRAVRRLEESEEIDRNVAAALMLGDAFHRERALMDGRLLRAQVVQVTKAGRKQYLRLVAEQEPLRVRARDVLVRVDQPKFSVEIDHVRDGEIACRVASGGRVCGLPEVGEVLELASHVPDWEFRKRIYGKVGRIRVSSRPVEREPVVPPSDPLAFAEGLT